MKPTNGGETINDISEKTCNTKQIDVIASTPFGLLSLIKDELTLNIPYSGPLKGTVIRDYTSTGKYKFNTFEEAQAKCSQDSECTGIDFEAGANYSTRKNKNLAKSPANYEEFAFAKIQSSSYTPSPWKIKITESKDWKISK